MSVLRRALPFFVLLLAVGCKRPTAAAPPAASVSGTTAALPAPSAAPAAKKASAGSTPAFLHVAPVPTGPVVVKGYPHNIANGMNEYADNVGFSADSALFVYSWETGGVGGTITEIFGRDGSRRTMSSIHSGDDKPNPKEVAEQKTIDKFLADEKIPALSKSKIENGQPIALGPALVGTWRYTDITLDVIKIEASGGDDHSGPTHPAHVQVGGAVAGEKPVHPIALVANSVPQAPPHWAVLNGFVMSPDGEDFGLLLNTFACEYCIDFAVKRISVHAMASLIYNDTGFRHHQKKEWAASAALFEKAVAADPTAKLPAYNLACAWARTGDPRTKDALAYAIELDPTVKTRAQKDDDLASVRGEPWFPKP